MLTYHTSPSVDRYGVVKKLIACLLFLLPVTLISVKSAGSVICLLLIGLAFLFRKFDKPQLTSLDRTFILAFLSPLVISLVQAVFIDNISGKYFEIGLRFALPLFVFIYLRKVGIDSRWLGYGCLFGIISALITVTVGKYIYGIGRPSNYFMNSLPFSGLTVVFAYLAFYLLTPSLTTSKYRFFLGAAIFSACGLILSITLARGAFLALSITAAFFLLTSTSLNLRRKAYTFAMATILAMSVYLTSDDIHQRVAIMMSEINGHLVKDEYTAGSIPIRFELWKASLLIFEESPIIGVGKGNFQYSLNHLIVENKIQDVPLFSHPHNEFFTFIAEQGLLGIGSYALLFVVPFCFFIRRKNSSDYKVKALSSAGLATVIVYFLLGLTNVVLLQMTVLTLYAFLNSYLASQIIYHQKSSSSC
ncbi:O-antigen ligase [Endozoicomonas sp. SESOKO1]|uniref:O-antigen ligase family protein n=1 Tax=Endozoicomonas sp. SESOKO1 TaxID=2828742 RepID=UPI0021489203|nr:O-antigen ligase family protein [Endozoicomonas sp. SESOKO1]